MTGRPSLSELVSSRIPKKGAVVWEDKLPVEIRAEMTEALDDFRAGLRGTKTGFARALSETLTELGHKVSRAGVEAWMQRSGVID